MKWNYCRGVTGGWAGWAIARIEGAAGQWQRATLLLAHPVIGIYILTRLKCKWTRKWKWKFVDIICTLAFFLFSINAHFQLSMTRTWNSTTFHDFFVYLTSLNTVEKEHLIFLPPWVEYEFWCKTGPGHISPVKLDCHCFPLSPWIFSRDINNSAVARISNSLRNILCS